MTTRMPITDEMRHHLEHEVDHVSHLLPSQGPIGTFIHHNTLHGLQHLPFEQAVAEGQRVLGGQGYLPNDEYRRFWAAGRIGDEDIDAAFSRRPAAKGAPLVTASGRRIELDEVRRLHLVHGIEPIDSARLRFEVLERDATERFRADIPVATRSAMLAGATAELEGTLDRVGRTWTLADWVQAHTNLDLPGWLRAEVTRQVSEDAQDVTDRPVDAWLSHLGIPADRRAGYVACIDARFEGAFASLVESDDLRRRWLREETRLLAQVARRHFGLGGTYPSFASQFAKDPEAYAVSALWHACLAACGLGDPFSPTDPDHLSARDPGGGPETMHQDFQNVERWGGPPIPLTAELHAAIQQLIERELTRLGPSAEGRNVDAVEAAQLWSIVHRGLAEDSLNRGGLEVLEALAPASAEPPRGRRPRAGGKTATETSLAGVVGTLRQRDPRRHMMRFAEEALADRMRQLGHDLSHSALLREVTDVDLSERVNRYMIRQCANFLDEGLAAWRMPGRTLGFYDAWRSLAISGPSLEFADLPGWRDAVRRLPESAEDAVIDLLHALGVAQEHWGDYLGRLLTQLPGWGGMIVWRATRPQYPRQQVQPIDLVQFLAVRLFYEAQLIQRLCQATWGLDGSVNSLRSYFEGHLPEFFVRRELFLGRLPDDLAEDARALAAEAASGDEHDARWALLADMTWISLGHGAADADPNRTAYGDGWRLFHLAQFLRLTPSEVRALSVDERDRLLGALDAFPASAHGATWLAAYEHHYREEILNALAANRGKGRWRTRDERPRAQVVYCIDEREEAIRRHLEELDPALETLGAAGFFGVAMNYCGLGVHEPTPLCPPVITPVHLVEEVARPEEMERLATHSRRAGWAAVFHNAYWEIKRNFVSAYFLLDVVGLLQTVPLFGQVLAPLRYNRLSKRVDERIVPPVPTALTVTRPEAGADTESHGDHVPLGFTTVEQADRVETMLRNLGLTSGFARLIVFTGHGSSSLNNPHESAHDCGACGGKHGGPSARAFAAMANRSAVRSLLRERGIDVPDDTWFVGSQHNTCSELYSYFDVGDIPATHRAEWARLVADLDEARSRSAQERCRRLGSAPKDVTPAESLRHIEGRSVDLSQVRPEWGHATNAFAVVGRRAVTQGLFLDRRPFLISYDPTQDPDGTILERIILAVGPVGAGINLEYYFSTVDNQRYGADTKVPHNVYGLVGVMEGAMSDLRTGLPRQMVEVHEPMRLQLVIEASTAHLGEIYGRQPAVQQLLDNAWVHLIAIDPDTSEMNAFVPGVGFVAWDRPLTPLPVVRSSFEWYRGKTDFLPPALIVQDGGHQPRQSAGMGTT